MDWSQEESISELPGHLYSQYQKGDVNEVWTPEDVKKLYLLN